MTRTTVISLLLLTGCSVYFDLKEERIPNALLLTGLLAALAIRGITPSLAAGLFLPLFFLGGFFLLHMMGAGDIKLFGVIGAFVGAGGILSILFYSFLCGALIALVLLLRRGNFLSRFRFFKENMTACLRTGMVPPYLQMTDRAGRLHLSVPVLAGVIWYVLTGNV